MTPARRLVVVILAGAIGTLAAAAPASAEWRVTSSSGTPGYRWFTPQGVGQQFITEDHFQRIVNRQAAYAAGRSVPVLTLTGDVAAEATAAQRVRDVELLLQGGANVTSKAKILSQGAQFLRGMGIVGPMSALGVVGLSATAGTIGWKIGTGIRALFVAIPRPPAPVTVNGIKGVDKGDTLVNIGHPPAPDGSTGTSFYALVDGFVATSNGNPALQHDGTGACAQFYPSLGTMTPVGGPDFSPQTKPWLTNVPRNCSSTAAATSYSVLTAPLKTDNGAELYTNQTVTHTTNAPATRTQTQLQTDAATNLKDPAQDEFNKWFLENDGEEEGDPTSIAPSCATLTFTACVAAFSAAGFTATPSRSTVTGGAIQPHKAPGAVLGQTPAGGAATDPGTAIVLTTNPDAAGMPIARPAINAGELGAAFADRLTALGLAPHIVVLTDTTLSTAHGPDEAVRLAPSATPSGSTDPSDYSAPGSTVEVYVNPATAPPASAGGGDPDIHAIDLAPLNVASACDNFPFGVPCWILDTMSTWVVTGVTAPVWHLPFPFTEGFDLNLDVMDPYAPLLRGLLLFLCTVGLAMRFYSLATGQSNGGGD